MSREKIVEAAAEMIGNPDTDPIWKDVLAEHDYQPGIKLAWCGAFALSRLHAAGHALGVKWRFGKGFLGMLKTVAVPEPGDIAYYDQPYQHHALVERVEGDTLHTIDGNQGHGPDHLLGTLSGTTVRRVQRQLSHGVYYSVSAWLHASIAEIQHRLNDLRAKSGDSLLTVNGTLDDPTRTALYWFQRTAGLPVTGDPDEATIKGLGL
jgi:hypothetical protein